MGRVGASELARRASSVARSNAPAIKDSGSRKALSERLEAAFRNRYGPLSSCNGSYPDERLRKGAKRKGETGKEKRGETNRKYRGRILETNQEAAKNPSKPRTEKPETESKKIDIGLMRIGLMKRTAM